MSRTPSGESCEAVRRQLIDAVMDRESFSEESLDENTRSHLAQCSKCRAFLNEVLAVKRFGAEAYRELGSGAEEAAEVRPDMEAISAAIDEGMARASGARPSRAATTAGATFIEKVAFLVFAVALVTAQVLFLRRLRPVSVLAIEVGLNWLAPFVFYVAFRIGSRTLRKEAAN